MLVCGSEMPLLSQLRPSAEGSKRRGSIPGVLCPCRTPERATNKPIVLR